MAFQVGDRVKLIGTVKESVTDKPSGRVSVLIGTDEEAGKPSKEYWAEEVHLLAAGTAQDEASAVPSAPAKGTVGGPGEPKNPPAAGAPGGPTATTPPPSGRSHSTHGA